MPLKKKKVFIDVYSGCGGLSLGLIQAGWQGLFAVEKDPMAFQTLKYNLIDKKKAFSWPRWLKQEAMPINKLLTNHSSDLVKLKGKVDLIAGGPPCQGFSNAGRRDKNDPRNKLTNQYMKVVKLISPRFLLLENVRGFDSAFTDENGNKCDRTYAQKVKARLTKLGYKVFSDYLVSSDFGVPQTRTRFILIAIKEGDKILRTLDGKTPFQVLFKSREHFLKSKGLSLNKMITVSEAISDLRVNRKKLMPCSDTNLNGFNQIEYKLPTNLSPYKKLMRRGQVNGAAPTDLRLANHKKATIKKFKKILSTCDKGKCLTPKVRERLGIKKHAITPLSASKPASTITTLPDDILHYSEPRILTVRENARIQSFPDWFSFKGKYTTGGNMRKKECPRYSQVGNAVPPLLGEALGKMLKSLVG
jgi:DNA (cytosine-5)-methyltransferase 1